MTEHEAAVGHKVRVLRDIVKKEGPYAKAGQEGAIVEVFQPPTFASLRPYVRVNKGPWYAKIRFGVDIKTLRLTSIEKIG